MAKENRSGCPISIAWDKEEGIDWINIRDTEGKIIMKVQKVLWDGGISKVGFTPVIRDSIITEIRRLFG